MEFLRMHLKREHQEDIFRMQSWEAQRVGAVQTLASGWFLDDHTRPLRTYIHNNDHKHQKI